MGQKLTLARVIGMSASTRQADIVSAAA